jgi:hypothetical protein
LKNALELDHCVDQRDTCGPEWVIGINITPTANFINNWIRSN